MKISKKYLTAFSGLIFILLTGIGLACAFEDLDYSHSHFFNPEMSKSEFHFFYRDTYFPFYSKTDETYAAPANDFTEINKKEWTDFFNNKISNEDMGTLLYKTNTLEIDSLIFRLKNNQYPLSGKLAKYSILKYDDKKTAISFLFYLGYAKRCEVYAAFIPGERWDDKTSDFVENPDPRKDISSINKLIEGGKDLLKNVKYQFVSDRYNFQIIRLYYHSNQFQPCLDFYQGIISKITQQSIKYRMMGYAAAAYYKLKNYSNANYLYSRIFSEYAPMRKTVFSSFAPKEETDFLQSLSLAESNKDKCALWAMVGIKNDPLRAMKEIYKLEPKSPYLSLLLTRAVNIEEEKFLVVPEGIPDDNQYFVINNYIMNYNKENYNFKSSSVNNDLVQFIKDVAAKNEINDPYLWQLSEAYLLSALGKYDEAVPFYAKAKLLCKGDIYLQTQV